MIKYITWDVSFGTIFRISLISESLCGFYLMLKHRDTPILSTYIKIFTGDICRLFDAHYVIVLFKQMPRGDGRMSSHSLTAQYHMHSYYPAGIYKAPGLASAPGQQPFFSCEDNGHSAIETQAVCEWHSNTNTHTLTQTHTCITCRNQFVKLFFIYYTTFISTTIGCYT